MLRRGGRMTPSLRRALIVLPIWILCSYWMWSWWIDTERANFLPLFIPLTLALIYEFLVLPSTFLYFVLKAKSPRKRVAQKGLKVAVISLCVPNSESIDIVEKQLKAMSEIEYPHDSWILDEGDSREIRLLAKKYGVKHFSRKGKAKYNQPNPPFKAKTKAGNVNAWLEHVKRRKYDYFVQFDIDHLAEPNYLHKTLGHFRDEKVAWVQAPSVYKNLEHWTARGSAEQELVLQGPLQMGFYGYNETPFIIGSHCTYRMSAVREIGGFQPTRAEDHLDTVMLSNRGYKGVFVPEVIARGDGPETLNTYLAQQFAWAYSMFQVLLYHSPKLLKGMPIKRKLLFLFAQTWYPLWSLSYLIMFMSPVMALVIGKDIASMSAYDFVTHFGPIFVASFLIWWTARPIMHPKEVGISWRGMILHVVRWPIVLRAIVSASFNITKPYMITPKGKFAKMAPSVAIYRIFLLFGIISSAAVIYSSVKYGNLTPKGQIMFALLNATLMAFVCMIDINIRLRQSKISFNKTPISWLKPVSALASLLFITAFAVVSTPVITNATYDLTVEQTPTKIVDPVLSKDINNMTHEEVVRFVSLQKMTNGDLPDLGIYNPNKETTLATDPYIKHVFANWSHTQYIDRQIALNSIDQNTLLLTIEPKDDNVSGEVLLENITLGKYDNLLQPIIETSSKSSKDIYIRFAHEMELAKVYKWGNQEPESYITAYQYVVDKFRSSGADNIKWVWAPAGNHGSEKYYPGDEYVDVIGTTVLHDKYWYGNRYVSFEELSEKRLWLKYYFNKPLWVVEFGAGSSNEGIQKRIIADARENYKAMGFDKLLYLNMVDANIVGPDYSLASLDDYKLDKEKVYIAEEKKPVELPEFSNTDYSIKLLSTH